MVKDDKRGHRIWWWVMGAAGLAFIMMVILLLPSGPAVHATPEETLTATWAPTTTPTVTPTPTRTPTATPTVNPGCELKVTKADSPDPVAPDEQITYTITVKNDPDTSGSCDGFTVTDAIPDDTDCVSIDVTDEPSGVDVDYDEDDCDTSGTITWDSNDDLDDGEQVVLKMVVELTSGADDGESITNEACATSNDDKQGDCDTEKTKVDEDAATATPKTATPGPTATAGAPTATPRPAALVVAPAPPAPSAVQAPSLVAPLTGTGTAAGGSQPLALALALAGGCLLLLGGVAMLRRPR